MDSPTLPGGPAPLYYRLRQAIRERVTSGEWQPGEQIPTIRELGEQYGVSRITVVQALDALSREGLLKRWQGKGIFVGEPKVDQGPVRLLSFTEETVTRGHAAASRTLRLKRVAASKEVAARLSLQVGEPVVLVERLRLADGTPMGLQQAYLPDELVPGLAERSEPIDSLYQVLFESYGVLPTHATDTYNAALARGEEARLLDVRSGAPVFLVERITTDQHERTVEYVRSVLRGDRYQVVLHLSRLGDA